MEECIIDTEIGPYTEFSCQYPTISLFYTKYEQNFNPMKTLTIMQDNPSLPIAGVVAYCAFCIFGKMYMKSRDPWQWRKILAVWNLSLCIFSWMGAMRTAPQLVYNLSTMSVRDNLCTDPRITIGYGSCGLWIQLFVLSKFPELLDTFFIVIHKKNLIFLHWYHHITVLLYCWHSYVTYSPAGIFFAVMNYGVHAIMYGYYFLMAIKMKPAWLNAMCITAAQISQMVVGVALTIAAFYYYYTEGPIKCKIQKQNNIAALLMYGSYLFLFAQFFVTRYFKKVMAGRKKEV